jgi:hypothetical protein
MKRRWIIGAGAVLFVLLIAGVTLLALIRDPNHDPFLSNAKRVRGQEYIQTYPGGEQYALEGVYKWPGDLKGVAAIVRKTLHAPDWKESPASHGTSLKFDSAENHLTILDRAATGEVTVVIQEFRKPTLSDKVRIWWNRHFKH